MKRPAIFCLLMFGFLFIASAQQERLPQFLKHTVTSGETAKAIAERFNVKLNDFLLINDFPPGIKLKPGQVVLVRKLKDGEEPPMEEAPVAAKEKESTPTKSNTTTTKPVEKEAKTESKAEATEHPAPSKPKPTKAAPKETESESAAPKSAPVVNRTETTGPGGTKYNVSNDGYHTVERGQTFYRIALIYGLTVDELKKLNNMDNTTIAVGQKLRVAK